jgi:tetratricopeptide (TPR) repeat protein
MPTPETFDAIARRLAREGAAGACAIEAHALEARCGRVPPLRADALRRAARGLRVAARILEQLGGRGEAGFRPTGLRGAIAAGHVALASGRPAEAELVGAGAAEAAPDAPAGLRLVAQALFARGRYGLAVRALRGALAADPLDPFTRALHVEALWFAGERVAARCALAAIAERADPLALALADAVRAGALARAGGEVAP